ncbi:MAG: hypothetical protein ACPGJV_14605 [Bacteriovoracaceae bacterium]
MQGLKPYFLHQCDQAIASVYRDFFEEIFEIDTTVIEQEDLCLFEINNLKILFVYGPQSSKFDQVEFSKVLNIFIDPEDWEALISRLEFYLYRMRDNEVLKLITQDEKKVNLSGSSGLLLNVKSSQALLEK